MNGYQSCSGVELSGASAVQLIANTGKCDY